MLSLQAYKPSKKASPSSSSCCRLWLGILVCILFLTNHGCYAEDALRRKLNAFTISLSPVPSTFTSTEVRQVRNAVETNLQTFLQTTAFASSNGAIQVDYVGLAAAQVVTSAVDNNHVRLQLTMTGLVYFSDDTPAELLPEDDAMLLLLDVAFSSSILLDLLSPIFPSITMAGLDLNLPDSPAPVPTPVPTTMIPTPVTEKKDDDDEQAVNGAIAGTNNNKNISTRNSSSSIGVIVGAVGGALIVSLLIAILFLTKRRQSRKNSNKNTRKKFNEDVWKVDLHKNHLGQELDFSPAKTEQMEDFDEEDVHQQRQLEAVQVPSPQQQQQSFNSPQQQQLQLQQQQQRYPYTKHPYSPNHTMSPMAATNYNNNNNAVNVFAATNKNMTMMNNQLSMPMQMNDDDDDVSSSLDFNVDDLISDFDDQTVSIRPHMIPVEPVESFEHERQFQHVVVKKDMLGGVASNSGGSGWQDNMLYDDNYNCALEPTDVSAATLAIKTRQSGSKNNNNGMTNLIPKISWWGRNNNNQQRHHHHDEVQSSDGTSFGGGGDWDPDDLSSMGEEGLAISTSDGIFSSISVGNKDEQSLLQHSLRNESYKMQRLRTPDNNKNTNRQRQINHGRGQTPPSALDMGRNNPRKILTLHYRDGKNTSSSDEDSDVIIM